MRASWQKLILWRALMSKLVFLGGTCANNNWRDSLIEELFNRGVPRECLFNPVVAHWDAAAQENEERAKASASHRLFYLADPKQQGNPLSYYSAVEATMALYDHPDTTVVVFDNEGIEGQYLKASNQAEKVLRKRHPNAVILGSRQEAILWLAKELI